MNDDDLAGQQAYNDSLLTWNAQPVSLTDERAASDLTELRKVLQECADLLDAIQGDRKSRWHIETTLDRARAALGHPAGDSVRAAAQGGSALQASGAS